MQKKYTHSANALPQTSQKIKNQLEHLHFKHTDICISPLFNDSHFLPTGCHTVSFTVSLNPGTPLTELDKVASGGELSRLLLAIYSIISEKTPCSVFLFDEIDTGIGGLTANSVGDLLKKISVHKQLFCITHLPQIATHADQHFLVDKVSDTSSTASTITPLNAKEKSEELARMIGGETILSAL